MTTRLFLALALTLLLCLGLGRVAQRYRQPQVLGEIVAGLACGPTLLGRLFPGVQSWIFPAPVVSMLGGLGQVAVALFAFEVGAGLVGRRPAEPLGRGGFRAVLPLAVPAALVPAGLGAALGPVLAARHLGGPTADAWALSAFLGTAVAVTAVPVLARVQRERHLESTRVGWLSLTASSLGDGFCWCVLGLALWLAGQVSSAALLLAVAGACGAATAVLLRTRAPRRERPGGERRPVSVLLPLVLVAALAGTTSWLGLHPLLGGILAGVLWHGAGTAAPESLPQAGDELPERQLSRVAAVLLPCFFLSAGLQVDLGRVLDPGFAGLVLLFSVLTVVSKAVAAIAVRRWYGLSRRETHRLVALLSTKGMTELVVLSVGLQAGLLSDRLYGALVAAALLLTLGIGPWLTALEDRDPERGREREPDRRTASAGRQLVHHRQAAGAGAGGLVGAAGDDARVADQVENG